LHVRCSNSSCSCCCGTYSSTCGIPPYSRSQRRPQHCPLRVSGSRSLAFILSSTRLIGPRTRGIPPSTTVRDLRTIPSIAVVVSRNLFNCFFPRGSHPRKGSEHSRSQDCIPASPSTRCFGPHHPLCDFSPAVALPSLKSHPQRSLALPLPAVPSH
jgi:hypothetical protein